MNHKIDLIEFYSNKLRPNINLENALQPFNPNRTGNSFILDCPNCRQRRAYIYDDSDWIQCNRKGNCTYGDYFTNALMKEYNQDWVGVIKTLCTQAGVGFPETEYTQEELERFNKRIRKQNIFNDFETIITEALYSPIGVAAVKYLEQKRGLPIDNIKARGGIGFYPSDEFIKDKLTAKQYLPSEIAESGLCREGWNGRIILVIKDRGTIGEFVARDITGLVPKESRWLRMNSDKAPDNAMLMGLDKAEEYILLVEGYFDYLVLDIAGVENVVALSGSQLTKKHIEKLKKHKVKRVNLLLDDDNGGNEGIAKIIYALLGTGITVYVIPPELLGGLDPDEYVIKHGGMESGADAINKLLDERIHGHEWMARYIAKKNNVSNSWKSHEVEDAFIQAQAFATKNENCSLEMDFFWKEFTSISPITEAVVETSKQKIEEKKADQARNSLVELKLKEIAESKEAGDREGIERGARELSDALKKHGHDKNSPRIQFLDNFEDDFLLTDAAPTASLIDIEIDGTQSVFIPRGIVGSVIGVGSVGKTHWLTQLALCMTTGQNFLGSLKIKNTGYVCLAFGENDLQRIHTLLRKTIKGLFGENLTTDVRKKIIEAKSRLAIIPVYGRDASFIDNQGNPSAFYWQFLDDLKATEPEEGYSLIVLDPASRFLGADAEKDNGLATLFISLLERITVELKGNPTVIFGHHMNKGSINTVSTGQDSARGVSAITDGPRWQLNLEKAKRDDTNKSIDENRVIMKVSKSNLTAYPPEMILVRGTDGHLTIEGQKKAEGSEKKPLAFQGGKRDHISEKPKSRERQNSFDDMAEL